MRYIDQRVLRIARDTKEMVYWISISVDESHRRAAVEFLRTVIHSPYILHSLFGDFYVFNYLFILLILVTH